MRHQGLANLHKINLFLMVFLFFAWQIGNIFWGEHIPAGDGLGWDGTIYARIAYDFFNLFFHHQIDQYSLQRILPSGIIYTFAKLIGHSLTMAQMPLAFSIYNTVILVLAVYTWQAIANILAWRPQVQVISFAGLFLNYAILKMNPYYPVLTDTSAFCCGLVMIYFFLAKKKCLPVVNNYS